MDTRNSLCQDQNKNLLAAAAVSVLADDRKERVKALVEAGTDAIVFDNRPVGQTKFSNTGNLAVHIYIDIFMYIYIYICKYNI